LLPSTFTALRTQGLPTRPLRAAAIANFSTGGPMETYVADWRGYTFWRELVYSRRAYRQKTGYNIEEIMGGQVGVHRT
jgi:hypothetical protein